MSDICSLKTSSNSTFQALNAHKQYSFLKTGFGEASWHHLTQTQACRRHRSLELLLSLAGYCTRLFKYFSSGRSDPYRVPSLQNMSLCIVQEKKKSSRHWFVPVNRTKESKITSVEDVLKEAEVKHCPPVNTTRTDLSVMYFFFTSHLPTWMQTLSDYMLLQMCSNVSHGGWRNFWM